MDASIRKSTWLALACVAACLVLLALRAAGAISFHEPLHVVTSGWEQESLLAIWESLHDRAVYVSRWDIPYRWAIYNWLFYHSYAVAGGGLLDLLNLDPAWLPTVTRTITLILVFLGCAMASWSFRSFLDRPGRDENLLVWAFAALITLGPLMGYWAVTTRPDPMAFFLEMTAVGLFWRLRSARPLMAVLLFCVVAYAAWSFKQSNVTAVGAVGLFLVARRQWASLAMLCVVLPAAWALTLWLGGETYATSILLTEYKPPFTPGHAVDVLFNFVTKAVPALVGTALVMGLAVASPAFGRRCLEEEPLVLAFCGVVVGAALLAATTGHPGSAENYYFTVSFFLSLMVLTGRRVLETIPPASRLTETVALLGWGAQLVAVLAVVGGVTGSLSVRFMHDTHAAAKACMDAQPRPLYIRNHYLSLPWLNPDSPAFVLAYHYFEDREDGRTFERGGIGGLIRDGYFASMLLPEDTTDQFDGASLEGYERVPGGCPIYALYLRRTPSP